MPVFRLIHVFYGVCKCANLLSSSLANNSLCKRTLYIIILRKSSSFSFRANISLLRRNSSYFSGYRRRNFKQASNSCKSNCTCSDTLDPSTPDFVSATNIAGTRKLFALAVPAISKLSYLIQGHLASSHFTLRRMLSPSQTNLEKEDQSAAGDATKDPVPEEKVNEKLEQLDATPLLPESNGAEANQTDIDKVCERENHPNDANRSLGGSEKRKHHHDEVDSFKDVKRAKIETRALKAKRPGFSDERFNETEYYFENGLRKVYPYYFTFTTFTKGRWVGERILDVFAREFRAHPVEEYERCIKSGTLTVNYEKVDVDYRLKHNDLLANVVHRHERPVLGEAVSIVHLDDDLVVVHKPPSVPVHPCGRYRHNTVAFILAKEHNLRNLRTIHRLDRLTSGLLLFGRTQEKARAMEQQIRTRLVSKEYVCRVEGEFPSEAIICEEPIEVVSFKIGVCRVSPKGKDCRTEFERMSFNGKTSAVLCRPHTGRMHQIRVHLQYLGYPIVNDPLYNHTVFGPEKGKAGNIGKTDEELIHDLISIHNAENWLGGEGEDFAPNFFSSSITPDVVNVATPASSSDSAGAASAVSSRSTTPDTGSTSNPIAKEESIASPNEENATADEKKAEISPDANPSSSNNVPEKACDTAQSSVEKPEEKAEGKTEENEIPADSTFIPEKVTFDEHCYECKVRFRDPKPKDLMMFLHALRYKGPGWSYETALPAWAESDWQNDEY